LTPLAISDALRARNIDENLFSPCLTFVLHAQVELIVYKFIVAIAKIKKSSWVTLLNMWQLRT